MFSCRDRKTEHSECPVSFRTEAPVAQWIEQRISNPVICSLPTTYRGRKQHKTAHFGTVNGYNCKHILEAFRTVPHCAALWRFSTPTNPLSGHRPGLDCLDDSLPLLRQGTMPWLNCSTATSRWTSQRSSFSLDTELDTRPSRIPRTGSNGISSPLGASLALCAIRCPQKQFPSVLDAMSGGSKKEKRADLMRPCLDRHPRV